MSDIYSPQVYEHFLNPKNAYRMEDADAVAIIDAPDCGDSLTLFIKVYNRTMEILFEKSGGKLP